MAATLAALNYTDNDTGMGGVDTFSDRLGLLQNPHPFYVPWHSTLRARNSSGPNQPQYPRVQIHYK